MGTDLDLFGEHKTTKDLLNRAILEKQIYYILRDISIDGFIGLIIDKFSAVVEYNKLLAGEKTCQRVSLLFNPHRLDTKSGDTKKSILQEVKTPQFASNIARNVIAMDGRTVVNFLYAIIERGAGSNSRYCADFIPYIVRDLCLEFGCDANSRILDPCGGWGGRMIGVSAVSNYYECYEPSTKTYEGLCKLLEFIKSAGNNFEANINCLPFEEAVLPANSFDFALTSPPYYDTEKYSDEETNSFNRYKSFNAWVEGFYLPLITKTMDALKPTKTFVCNIGSRRYPLSKILMDNFAGKYQIKKLGNYLSGNAGLGKEGEGEMFYAITKPN